MMDSTREVEVRERIGHDRRLARHDEEGKTERRSSSHTHHFAYAGEDNLRTNKREDTISRAKQLICIKEV